MINKNSITRKRLKGKLDKNSQILIDILAYHFHNFGTPANLYPFNRNNQLEELALQIKIYQKKEGEVSISYPLKEEVSEIIKKFLEFLIK